MSGIIETIFVMCVVVMILIGGSAYGSDSLRRDIIDTCIARNPDMANSKVKQYCIDQFDSLLDKEYGK